MKDTGYTSIELSLAENDINMTDFRITLNNPSELIEALLLMTKSMAIKNKIPYLGLLALIQDILSRDEVFENAREDVQQFLGEDVIL